jgi:hypothetical protein
MIPREILAALRTIEIHTASFRTVRGYTVTSDTILVQRLFWTTRLPLAGLQSARFEPEAMRWSIRTFGNGGLFSFTGCFRNKLLGAYRAFVTDPRRAVVLRYSGRSRLGQGKALWNRAVAQRRQLSRRGRVQVGA